MSWLSEDLLHSLEGAIALGKHAKLSPELHAALNVSHKILTTKKNTSLSNSPALQKTISASETPIMLAAKSSESPMLSNFLNSPSIPLSPNLFPQRIIGQELKIDSLHFPVMPIEDLQLEYSSELKDLKDAAQTIIENDKDHKVLSATAKEQLKLEVSRLSPSLPSTPISFSPIPFVLPSQNTEGVPIMQQAVKQEKEIKKETEKEEKETKEKIDEHAAHKGVYNAYFEGRPTPITQPIIQNISKNLQIFFKEGFLDGQMQPIVTAIMDAPIQIINVVICKAKTIASTIEATLSSKSDLNITPANKKLINFYLTILQHEKMDPEKSTEIPASVIDEYCDLPKDSLSQVQWAAEQLGKAMQPFYDDEEMENLLWDLRQANLNLITFKRSGSQYRNANIFSHEIQASIETPKTLAHFKQTTLEQKKDKSDENGYTAYYKLQKTRTINALSRVIEKYNQEIKKQHKKIKDRETSLVQQGLIDSKSEYIPKILEPDYELYAYYNEQKRRAEHEQSALMQEENEGSGSFAGSNAPLPSYQFTDEEIENFIKLQEYEDRLEKRAEGLKNRGSLTDDEIKQSIKVAYLRFGRQLAEAWKKKDINEARQVHNEALAEFRIYQQWFNALPNNNKNELLEEVGDKFTQTPSNPIIKYISAILAVCFGGVAGGFFAQSGYNSVTESSGVDMSPEFEYTVAYYGAFLTNFLNYCFGLQAILERLWNNLKVQWNWLRTTGRFTSSDFKEVEIENHWKKIQTGMIGLGYAIGSTLIVCFGFMLTMGPLAWLLALFFLPLSLAIVSNFLIGAECDNLPEQLNKKFDTDPNASFWENVINKSLWGATSLSIVVASGGLGWATAVKFIAALSEYVTLYPGYMRVLSVDLPSFTLVGASIPLIVALALIGVGIALLLTNDIPFFRIKLEEKIRIPIGLTCLIIGIAILAILASFTPIGPGVLLFALFPYIFITTAYMAGKMLFNAALRLLENCKALWNNMMTARKENPDIGMPTCIALFTICLPALLFNAAIFGILTVFGMEGIAPMVEIDVTNAIAQPIWSCVFFFSILNGLNSSVNVQGRFGPLIVRAFSDFCNWLMPRYNRMMSLEHAKGTTWTFPLLRVASLLIIMPIMLICAIPISLTVLLVNQSQKPENGQAKKTMNPMQMTDFALTYTTRWSLKYLNKTIDSLIDSFKSCKPNENPPQEKLKFQEKPKSQENLKPAAPHPLLTNQLGSTMRDLKSTFPGF